MRTWFLKAITHDAGLDSIPNTETEQELDLALNNIGSVVGGAIFQGQKNCVNTIKKSMKYIDPNIEGNNIDADMNLRLLRLSTEFSSDDMQEIIAKILAGEYNKPGTFSIKTLDVVKNLSKKDLELFQRFGSIIINNDFYFKNWYTSGNKTHEILDQQGLSLTNIMELQGMGLVFDNDIVKTSNNIINGEHYFFATIQGKAIPFKTNGEASINGVATLTKAGKEILPLLPQLENNILFELIKKEFINKGFSI